ncbi:MAG: acetyl-coenzyme A synthetase [Actinobacteria bacterium]|nr:MAG: acetyl-coenzyme A synthetase [Actinomycetota bacterium]
MLGRRRTGEGHVASERTIETLFDERRTFPPPPEFARHANANDPQIYARAPEDFEGFWAEQAKLLKWTKPWTTVLEWDLPFAKWFVGGTLNVSVNCLDRHVAAGGGDKIAYYFEGEPGDRRTLTYAELLAEVCRFGNALRALGIRKGDRIAIYMPMIPELPIAMLACARIGAAHSVVFGGFSSDALSGRIQDAGARLVVTADGGWRRGGKVPLKQNADEAVASCPTIEHVIVVERTHDDVPMTEGRDLRYADLVAGQASTCEPEEMDSEDLLFTLYTSGTTAKPKGIVHTTGGYLTGVSATHRLIFDIKPDDVYWCAADIGWVTGHSYIVYGPLANHTTGILYEGAPDWPEKDRFWTIVEHYRATILYTAPTAIRAFMRWGEDFPAKHDLSSLRLLGSVGEPINPEAWMWYYRAIGGERCPIVDTWPSMLRGIWGDPERYKETYWSRFPGRYFAGDGCRVDSEGDYWFMGRVDDVMNVAGHRISTTEVESALVDHAAVAEAAVVGKNDPQTGQAIFAYVITRAGVEPTGALGDELREHVAEKIGKLARPKQIVFTPELPKTRSGKIMRRLLRDVAEERTLGDVTTLADPAIVEEIRSRASAKPEE